MNRIEIPITGGRKLVAEQNCDPDYSMELYVGIEDSDGSWIQDLVCVQNDYRYKPDGQLDWKDGMFRVIVWADHMSEDMTDEFVIPLWEDP